LFHRSTIFVAPVCYLQDLFTTSQLRGKGVASALIQAVADAARAAGAGRLYWLTHETNTVAKRLYDKVAERSGFIMYRRSC
jgi:GNAT superfamily N-acetyltransferase